MNVEIKKMLLTGLERKNQSVSQVSEILTIDRSVINKYVNGQRIPNIEQILKINEYLIDGMANRHDALKIICEEMKSVWSLKIAIEIARYNRDENMVRSIARKLRTASKPEVKEWADFYQLFTRFREGTITQDEYYDQMIQFKIRSTELEAYRQLSLAFYHFGIEGDLIKAYKTNQKAEVAVNKLDNSLLKRSYLSRLYGLYGALTLRLQNKEVAVSREYYQKCIDYSITELTKSVYRYNLATTYIFSDKEKAIEIMETEIAAWKKEEYFGGVAPLAHYLEDYTIITLKIFNGELETINVEEIHDECKILYYIHTGDLEQAKVIYKRLEPLAKEKPETLFSIPMYYLCGGILYESTPLLFQALSKLVETYNLFEAKYAIDELVKQGVSMDIIDAMISSKIGSDRIFIYS